MSVQREPAGRAAGAPVTVIHLVRHGEVENPAGILYGRLPGYHLSPAGREMARAAARYLAGHDVAAVFSSPLERATETAEPFAEMFGLQTVTDMRLIEPWNHFQGMRFGVGDGSLRQARHWPYLRNPFLPSWGEPYRQISARVLAAMGTAAGAARGREAVCVTHQLPIWVTRRLAEGHRLWHLPNRRQCALCSITSFTYAGDEITGVSYAEPAGSGRHQVAGA